MAVITKQELEDAAADAFSLEKVVNGSATEGGTGVVTTRLGQQIKTVQKVITDLAAVDVGASAAAQLNQALLATTPTHSGAARALIGNSVTPALSRGTHTQGNDGFLATGTGWRAAFKHNGSNFDTVQLTFKTITNPADVVIEILNTDGLTVLAKGLAKGTTTLKTHTVVLDRVLSGIAENTILFIAYRSVNRTTQLSYPGGGVYESGVDNSVYREAYTQAVDGWVPVVTPNAAQYLIPFRLFNLSDFSRSLSDETAANAAAIVALDSGRGKVNAWPDPFFRLLDLSTVAAGFLSKSRFWGGGANTTFSLIKNPVYDGQALQRLATAQSAPLNGPLIHLNEIGAVAGDKVTLRMLVTGNGAVVSAYMRQDRGADANWATGSSQEIFLNSAGAGATTTSSTPQMIELETTVASDAARCALYFTHTGAAGLTYQIVALWGYRGTKAQGPTSPGGLAETQAYQDTLKRLETAENSLEPTVQRVNYALESFSTVSSDSSATQIAGTNFTSVSRALVFTGWGERYVAAGVSFNLLNIVTISRSSTTETDKWRTLYVFVRKGPNSHQGGGVVLAVGEALVPPNNNVLNNVQFILRDPFTQAIKTLSNADFVTPDNPTGEYFIGVYAKNALGDWAACGEPNGTMTNTQGNSYYATSSFGDPAATSWAVSSGNTRMCFQHILAVNPEVVYAYGPTEAFINDLSTQLTEGAPELILPPTVYAVQGREFNLYFDNLFLGSAWDYNINVDSAGAVGFQLDECWRWNPAGAVTTGNLTVAAYGRNSGKLLVSGTTAQRSAAASAGSGTNKKILYIGDSLVNNGTITQTLLDIAGTDVMGVTLYGTRGSGLNRHEGRGGWSIPDYTTAGRTAYQFTVSGVTTVPTQGSTYTHNGSTYTVEWTNITAGSGTVTAFMTNGTATPTASGALTRTSGAGDLTINFSASAAVSGNPFWINGALDFAGYLSAQGYPAPDWVFIALGINDVFGQTDDTATAAFADSRFLQLDNLITSIKAANVNTRVGIVIPTPPTSSQDAFGFNYTTGQTRWRDKRNVLIWGRQLISKYAGQTGNRVYVVPSNTALDTVNNYDRSAPAPVNSRAPSVLIARQNNGVHPGVTGYQQIGDAVWAFLKYHA